MPILLFLLFPAAAWMTIPKEALLARSSTRTAASGKDIAITDVLTLLQGMRDRTGQQIDTDKTHWTSYTAWSETQESDKNAYNVETKSVMLTATSTMNSNLGQVTTLEEALSLLGNDIGETQASLSSITSMRADEHSLHQAELSDLTSTITAVNKAITILESKYTAGALVQAKKEIAHAMELAALTKVLSSDQTKILSGMLQEKQPDASTNYGEYSSQAGGGAVVDTLKTLRSTLMENKQASIEKENDARRSYEETKKTKEDDLARMQFEQTEKTTQKGTAQSTAAAAQAEIGQCNENIQDANDYIKLLQDDRAHFQGLYNERLGMRNTELSATQAAIDALQQVSLSASLLSIKARKGKTVLRTGLIQAGLNSLEDQASKLKKLGAKLHSHELVDAAVAVESLQRTRAALKAPAAFYDPAAMEPVKELLRQLINRLEDELSAEMSHKEWCETERATGAASKTARENLITSLQAEIPQLETQINSLTSEIDFLGSELVRNREETDAAKTLRQEQKTSFETSHEDHNQVIEALSKAIEALSSVSFGFVQTTASHSLSRGSPFSASNSEAGSAGSANEMLTDLLNKYSSARAAMAAEEEASTKSHEQFLTVSETFRQDTEQTKAASTSERRLKSNRLADARDELTNAGTELQQVTQYLADLVPSCDDIRSTFDERKKRREAEIAALKETLAALGDLAGAGR